MKQESPGYERNKFILAIDPGNIQSAFTLIGDDLRPLRFGKVTNGQLAADLSMLAPCSGVVAIEQIGHYGTGMPAGRTVFDTCRWIGRFEQILESMGITPQLVLRQPVKLHHCHSPRANDATIRQALVDRFAPGEPNHGKGTKTNPGFFYGFKADIWQSFALAVYIADHIDAKDIQL